MRKTEFPASQSCQWLDRSNPNTDLTWYYYSRAEYPKQCFMIHQPCKMLFREKKKFSMLNNLESTAHWPIPGSRHCLCYSKRSERSCRKAALLMFPKLTCSKTSFACLFKSLCVSKLIWGKVYPKEWPEGWWGAPRKEKWALPGCRHRDSWKR